MNETAAIVSVVSSKEDVDWNALWTKSVALTCAKNDVVQIVVDASGSELQCSAKTVVVKPEDCRGWCRAIEVGVKAALEEVDPGVLVFCHSDVVAMRDGWLDTVVEAVFGYGAAMATFDPLDALNGTETTVAYPGDWCVAVSADAWKSVGGAFHPALDSFCGVAWLYEMFESEGMIVNKITSDSPTVVHAWKNRSRGNGRRSADGAPDELVSFFEIRREIRSKSGEKR